MTGVAEERYSEPLVGFAKSETSSELLLTVSENPERTLSFAEEQQKDSYLHAMHKFLEKQQFPDDPATKHLRKDLLDKTHQSQMGGHFSGQRLYNALTRNC